MQEWCNCFEAKKPLIIDTGFDTGWKYFTQTSQFWGSWYFNSRADRGNACCSAAEYSSYVKSWAVIIFLTPLDNGFKKRYTPPCLAIQKKPDRTYTRKGQLFNCFVLCSSVTIRLRQHVRKVTLEAAWGYFNALPGTPPMQMNNLVLL